MPKLDKMFTLEVTPEQFLRNCSKTELIETDLLLQSPTYQLRMYGSHTPEAKEKQLLKLENNTCKSPDFPTNNI